MWPFKRKKTTAARAFNGAIYDKLTSDWITSSTSQDAEIRASLPRLRNRSRDLGRNNDYVRQFFRAVQNNVVGQGINLQAQVKKQRGGTLDVNSNAAIETSWEKWKRAENCDVTGKMCFQDIERLVIRSIFESGEVIVRFIYQRMGGSKVPMALEIIESDLLDDNYNAISPEGNAIRMGVEVNQWGRPVAYWFFRRHPGDSGVMPNLQREPYQRVRVPADEIRHLFFTERPGQTRGIPSLAAAIQRLRHMQGYEEAEVIAARATACNMGFINSPEIDPSIKDDVDEQGDSVTEFEPGVMKKLSPGETFTAMNPTRPGNQFDPFIRVMLRGLASSVGTSYETISRDYSQSNYSSTRQALIEDRDNWRAIQWWLISNLHVPVFEKWLDLAVLSGELQLKGYETNPDLYKNVKWMPRGWSWIDPLKEVQAYKAAVRSGFMTQAEVVAQAGGDFEELIVQRGRELELAKENGVMLDTDPIFVSDAGITQARPAGSAALDPEDPQPDPPEAPSKPKGKVPAEE
jgi:lambda family phage portal protein